MGLPEAAEPAVIREVAASDAPTATSLVSPQWLATLLLHGRSVQLVCGQTGCRHNERRGHDFELCCAAALRVRLREAVRRGSTAVDGESS